MDSQTLLKKYYLTLPLKVCRNQKCYDSLKMGQ